MTNYFAVVTYLYLTDLFIILLQRNKMIFSEHTSQLPYFWITIWIQPYFVFSQETKAKLFHIPHSAAVVEYTRSWQRSAFSHCLSMLLLSTTRVYVITKCSERPVCDRMMRNINKRVSRIERPSGRVRTNGEPEQGHQMCYMLLNIECNIF